MNLKPYGRFSDIPLPWKKRPQHLTQDMLKCNILVMGWSAALLDVWKLSISVIQKCLDALTNLSGIAPQDAFLPVLKTSEISSRQIHLAVIFMMTLMTIKILLIALFSRIHHGKYVLNYLREVLRNGSPVNISKQRRARQNLIRWNIKCRLVQEIIKIR